MRSFFERHSAAVAVAIYFAFLLFSGLLPSGQVEVGPWEYVAFCVFTGIFEEAIFCGLIYKCLARRSTTTALVNDSSIDVFSFAVPSKGGPSLKAAAITALFFGLAHLSLASGIALALGKAVQATAFGFCMVGLYCWTRHLVAPMVAHALFDALYFLPAYLATGALPPYGLTGTAAPMSLSPDGNIALLAGTTLLFGLVALIMVKFVFKPDDDR